MVRTAVVTGGMSGIGAASAQRLAIDGVEIVRFDIGVDADVVVDVSDPAAVAAAANSLGPVDIVVNSAGVVGPNAFLWEVDDDAWARTIAVNLTGTFNMCRAVAPGMR